MRKTLAPVCVGVACAALFAGVAFALQSTLAPPTAGDKLGAREEGKLELYRTVSAVEFFRGELWRGIGLRLERTRVVPGWHHVSGGHLRPSRRLRDTRRPGQLRSDG